jgi:hypothetical protein
MHRIQNFISSIPVDKDKGKRAEFQRILQIVEKEAEKFKFSERSTENIIWLYPYLRETFVKARLDEIFP